MMQPDRTLYVFPTTRSLNKTLLSKKTLANYITIKEFFEKAFFKPECIKVDENIRFLLLKESISTLDIEPLGFSKNFIEFIEHSPFIFRFFDEVVSEGASFDTIRSFDIYAGFDEHIDILEAIHNNYCALLDKEGFYDPIHSKELVVNAEYFKHFSAIELRASGYLTRLELERIKEVSSLTPITLHIDIDSYNQNMIKKLSILEVEASMGSLSVDIEKKLVNIESQKSKRAELFSYELKERLSQVPLCFSLLKDILARSEPENIAIIALDESFIDFLSELDYHNNLNFAMGFPIAKTALFRELKAKLLNPKEGSPFYTLDKKRGFKPLLEAINKEFRKEINYTDIKEQLFKFERLNKFFKARSSKEIGVLFLERIKNQSIDDSRGGRIKVIGLLEARDIELDEIILLDFNKGIFPKSSFKDLFLNSFIKQKSNIPTPKQRENLQMHHLLQTLRSVKKAHILYTQNSDLSPSKFLSFLKTTQVTVDEESLNSCFFGKSQIASEEDDPVRDIDLKTHILSHSKLNAYLACKRRFYYRYIEKIPEPKDKDSSSLKIGNLFHEFMEKEGARIYESSDELHGRLREFFANRLLAKPYRRGFRPREDSSSERGFCKKSTQTFSKKECFDVELFLLQALEFSKLEYERRKEGFLPLGHEVPYSLKIEGFRFEGRIDRIDVRDGKEYIIDYKTGKNIKVETKSTKKIKNFQLLLYALGRMELGKKIGGTYLYDIRGGKLKEESIFELKLEILKQRLEELEPKTQVFSKTETKSECR